ncbi:Replication initiator protein A (RepA) N-terminus [Streptococcus henryi]|uniref:Replication initiator protein A (RepA) N-terminus n=1 Tax=Streptococcus henryi TaxID=439219 RepID=A0A1G6BPD9_9STRE|nr:replication initiator protein A [Streptococcus henryi]SDB22460.1 Replication initiator protein A (RepA) N-terminus [Streptococcus henryi]
MTVRDITIHQLETQKFHPVPQLFSRTIQKKWDKDHESYLEVHYVSPYCALSSDAKLSYGIFLNRCQLSIYSYQQGKRDYVDENGAVFMIFTVDELMKVLDKSKNTVLKIKKELTQLGLLREVRQGKNKPNRLYLQNVDATTQITEYYDEDNVLLKKVDYFGTILYEKEEEETKGAKSLGTSGSSFFELPEGGSKNGPREVQNLNPSNTDKSKTYYNDTNRYKDDPPLSQLSDSEAFKMGQHGFLSDLTIQRLSLFGKEAKGLENKIYQAKRQVEKECHYLLGKQEIIYGEIWSQELEREVEKLIFKVKTGEQEGKPIQNLPGYFYKMMLHFWKMALLIEKEQGFIALSNQSDYAKQFPEECPSLIGYYYPDKLSEAQLNQYLTMLRMETLI